MLLPVKELKKYICLTNEGTRLSLKDLYIDKSNHQVAYLVCGRFREFSSKKFLIKPSKINYINKNSCEIFIDVTQSDLNKNVPNDSIHLISNEMEEKYNYKKGVSYLRNFFSRSPKKFKHNSNKSRDRVLYSQNEVSSYLVSGKDGNLGWLEDLIVDTDNWTCSYVAFSAHNDAFSSLRVLPTTAIKNINWYLCSIFVDKNIKDTIDMPFYESLVLINKTYELGLYQYLEEKKKLQSGQKRFKAASGNN